MTGFFKDLFSGNFSALEKDVTSGIAKLPDWAQKLVTTLESDAGQLLNTLVTTAAQDVLNGGLTTASFTAAAKDVESKLVSQGITLGTQTVYVALNGVVASLAPAAPATPVIPAESPSA